MKGEFVGVDGPRVRTEAGVSAPLTLAEVREMQEDFRGERGTDEQLKLCATIEWLAERIDSDTTIWVDSQLEAWLRGEA